MPDDSSAASRFAQQQHSARIQLERGLSRLTGLSPNQVRKRLRQAADDLELRRQGQVAQAQKTQTQDSTEVPKTSPAQIEPRPFGPQATERPAAIPYSGYVQSIHMCQNATPGSQPIYVAGDWVPD